VEHPAPTGFSHCSGYDTFQCPPWDDESQADASFNFFVEFFSSNYYPELAENDFWFSGESYAGVLVPTLSKRLLAARNQDNQHVAPYNVRGFALGNDCPGNRVYTCTPYSGWLGTQVALDFRFRHGMINESLYNDINEACSGEWNTFEPPSSPRCRELLEDPIRPVMSSAGDTYEMGGGYYLYDTCDPDLLALDPVTNVPRQLLQEKDYMIQESKKLIGGKQKEIEIIQTTSRDVEAATHPEFYNNAGTYACGQEKNSLVWLNLDAVRQAIHVPTKAENGRTFGFSTALPGYNFTAHSLLDLYNSTLIGQLTIMQYSGEADPCVPYIGTERWIQSLQMNVIEPWSPWKSGNYFAGYKTRYQGKEEHHLFKNNKNIDTSHFFDFVTVRNAGHMVPRYKPEASLLMMKNFLRDANLYSNKS
jgi:serine carboxypeptidase-like clade I